MNAESSRQRERVAVIRPHSRLALHERATLWALVAKGGTYPCLGEDGLVGCGIPSVDEEARLHLPLLEGRAQGRQPHPQHALTPSAIVTGGGAPQHTPGAGQHVSGRCGKGGTTLPVGVEEAYGEGGARWRH